MFDDPSELTIEPREYKTRYHKERKILRQIIERHLANQDAVPVQDLLADFMREVFPWAGKGHISYDWLRDRSDEFVTSVLSSLKYKDLPEDDHLEPIQRYYRNRRDSNYGRRREMTFIVRVECMTYDELTKKAAFFDKIGKGNLKHKDALLYFRDDKFA